MAYNLGQPAGETAPAQAGLNLAALSTGEGRTYVLYVTADQDVAWVEVESEQPRTLAAYAYDGLGRRIAKTLPDRFVRQDRFDYYYNESWQCLEERKAAGQAQGADSPAAATYAQYVWDARYIDAPVVRWRDSDDDEQHTLDETLYYTTDANMNVTAVIDRSTGLPAERYSYDPYGKVTIHEADWSGQADWESSRWNEILYCGYRYDWETGNYHVRNRNYHPALGRFTSRDPAGYNDGLNVYQYGQSDPAGTTDPMGLDSGWWEWNKGFWKTCLQQTNPGIRAVVYGRQAVDRALAGDRWGAARAMMAVWSIDGGLLAKADQARADAAEYLVYRQKYGVSDSLCLLAINKCLGDETGYTKIADSLERRTRMGGDVPAEEAGSSAAEGGLQVAGTVGKIVGLLYAIPVGAGAGAAAGAGAGGDGLPMVQSRSVVPYRSGAVVSQYTGPGAQAGICASSNSGVVWAGSAVGGPLLESYWAPAGGFWQAVRVPVRLPRGTLISRYGGEGGAYVAPDGVGFAQRALPRETLLSHPTPSVYQVVQPFQVEAGFAEPWFGYPGMGVQYKLPWTVKQGIPTYLERR